MLRSLYFDNEDVLAYVWVGDLNQKTVKQSIAEFLPELKSRDEINVYIEIKDIDEVEAKALWADLKFSFAQFNEVKEKINKLALVTDKFWLRNLADVVYKFVPGISQKSFTFKESPEAKEWIGE